MKRYNFKRIGVTYRVGWVHQFDNALQELMLYVTRFYEPMVHDDEFNRDYYSHLWREEVIVSKVTIALLEANTSIRS